MFSSVECLFVRLRSWISSPDLTIIPLPFPSQGTVCCPCEGRLKKAFRSETLWPLHSSLITSSNHRPSDAVDDRPKVPFSSNSLVKWVSLNFCFPILPTTKVHIPREHHSFCMPSHGRTSDPRAGGSSTWRRSCVSTRLSPDFVMFPRTEAEEYGCPRLRV